MGTLVNAGAIIVGGAIGLLFKKTIKEDLSDALIKVIALCVVVLGIFGMLSYMATIVGVGLETDGMLLLIISMALGLIIGHILKIDDRLNNLGAKIENKIKIEGFSKGFIFATMLYCVGAMAIIGSLNDGLLGDPSTLYIKAMLDGISSILLTATLGAGVIFSAIPLLIYQGAITLGAKWVSPYISQMMLSNLCMVGFMIVMIIGTNMAGMTKIKTANLIPALLIPIVYSLVYPLIFP